MQLSSWLSIKIRESIGADIFALRSELQSSHPIVTDLRAPLRRSLGKRKKASEIQGPCDLFLLVFLFSSFSHANLHQMSDIRPMCRHDRSGHCCILTLQSACKVRLTRDYDGQLIAYHSPDSKAYLARDQSHIQSAKVHTVFTRHYFLFHNFLSYSICSCPS